MVVTAPRDGSVLRLIARQGGEMVKAGDPIAQFVPDTEARAVELWLDGIDAPLGVGRGKPRCSTLQAGPASSGLCITWENRVSPPARIYILQSGPS